MSDPIDIAADRAELERANAIANHANRPKPMRIEWGAIRCVPCESAHERRARR